MKKNLTLLVVDYSPVVLGKDAFLVPYYWNKQNNFDVNIVYPYAENNKDMPVRNRGINHVPVKFKGTNKCFSFRGEWYFFFYLLSHAKDIDVLMRFHFSFQTALLALWYKFLKPDGTFYLKGDGFGLINSLFRKDQRIQTCISNTFIRFILNKMFKVVDLISVEHNEVYEVLSKKQLGLTYSNRLVKLSNGFDEDLYNQYGIERIPFQEKENIFLTVGRLGTFQKNTEMILDAIKQTNMQSWKLVLIGPIDTKESNFQHHIDRFYQENPELIDKVFFTGNISDKKTLWEWYNRSKVFILSSRSEGYALVYFEALWFDNYLITTDVGGAKDSLDLGHGEIIPQEDPNYLALVLNNITTKKLQVENLYNNYPIEKKQLSWNNLITVLGNI